MKKSGKLALKVSPKPDFKSKKSLSYRAFQTCPPLLDHFLLKTKDDSFLSVFENCFVSRVSWISWSAIGFINEILWNELFLIWTFGTSGSSKRHDKKRCNQLIILFFFDNITYRRAIEEREIKYHFISRCSKGTPLAQRAIKLTLLTAHYFIARWIKIMLSKKNKIRYWPGVKWLFIHLGDSRTIILLAPSSLAK